MYGNNAVANMTGQKIASLKFSDGKIVLTTESNDCFVMGGEGVCCASCWIEHMDGADVVGGTILSLECGGWKTRKDDGCDVEEEGFYTLNTNKGAVQIDLRLSHNGYYGGTLEVREVG